VIVQRTGNDQAVFAGMIFLAVDHIDHITAFYKDHFPPNMGVRCIADRILCDLAAEVHTVCATGM
jgi:hypothetical protein